jgi:tRNA-dihydrouridine synthase B
MSASSVYFKNRDFLNGKVNFPLCLAPMVGLSHVALRRLVKSYLPAEAKTIWPTEMLNSRKIPFEDLTKTDVALRHDSESELVPQILGNEEAPIRDSIVKLQDEWGAEGIDINMGCPVEKALKHNYGVSLMGDADYAARVVEMAAKWSKGPVSVKLRAVEQSSSDSPEVALEKLTNFVQGLKNAGASWICLHPRTAEQKRRGSADWSQIQWLKQTVSGPIVGNGDIQTSEDVYQMLDKTDCDLVMSGRALAARPWMMWQIAEDLGLANPEGREGKAPRTPEEEGQEYGRALLQFIDYCDEAFTPSLALRKIRFYIRTTQVWLLFGHSLIGLADKAQDLNQLRFYVRDFFAAEQMMVRRTELRQ